MLLEGNTIESLPLELGEYELESVTLSKTITMDFNVPCCKLSTRVMKVMIYLRVFHQRGVCFLLKADLGYFSRRNCKVDQFF